ncbi:M1 family metallopeptidase [Streptoalloteichus hindustanus]|uniref:Aminopeptidase N n=1 Tax=Streptoalloteichus hindustanus TaxID=2017 RepID=A0A1M4TTD4_STRHI|nr:M1 family metallopeptidase [Streptoalloteichus hindustanus]SHE47688.1 Peptidase family M1 [Streptoalloteichus hindustanus]
MAVRNTLRVAAAATCALALLALPAGAGTEGPGSAGVGDPYFPTDGNGGYDVAHYDIRLKYQPSDDRLEGTTTIVAKPTQDLTRFNLDFALKVNSIRVNGTPVRTFTQQGKELQVTPATTLRRGSLLTIVVDYADTPSNVKVDGTTAWRRTSDGAVAIDEPHISSWWFPGNDHPTDKATFDISVAVPEGTEVLSNGVLKSNPTKYGWTRWNWRSTKPMATYLAFLAVGQYEINTKTGYNGQPFVTAYSEGLGEIEGAAKASIERTPEAVEFLVGLYGDYPFEAQGGVVPKEGLGFALENQTRPTYSPAFFRNGANMYVVVHENAHQWFGDSVSVQTWRNVWLNEGFATYSEWLWSEAKGEGTAQQLFDYEYGRRPADDPFWQVLPGDPGSKQVFHNAVYDRGAMTLHALRTEVGDQAFFSTIKSWVAQKKYQNGTIEEFIAHAEKISGKKLGKLFETWLFTKGKPQVGAQSGVAASAALAAGQFAAAAAGDTTAALPAKPKSADKIRATHETLHSAHSAHK